MKYSPSTHELFSSEFIKSGVYVRVPDDLVTLSDIQIENLKNKPPGSAIYHDADMNLHYSSIPPSTEHSFNYSSLQWEIDPAKVEAARKASIPNRVPMVNAKLALLQAGMLDAVDAALNGIQDATLRRAALLRWEGEQWLVRDDELVRQVVSTMQIGEKQLDDLFALAGSL